VVQAQPAESVWARSVHRPEPQGAVPSAQPSVGDTKVTEEGRYPAGTGARTATPLAAPVLDVAPPLSVEVVVSADRPGATDGLDGVEGLGPESRRTAVDTATMRITAPPTAIAAFDRVSAHELTEEIEHHLARAVDPAPTGADKPPRAGAHLLQAERPAATVVGGERCPEILRVDEGVRAGYRYLVKRLRRHVCRPRTGALSSWPRGRTAFLEGRPACPIRTPERSGRLRPKRRQWELSGARIWRSLAPLCSVI